MAYSRPTAARYPKGSFIIIEGKPSENHFFIIKEGQVRITRATDSAISEENTAGPGEMFGVVSAIASRSFIESAEAVTDVTVLAAERNHIIKSTPVAINVIKQFSQRLRKLDDIYSRRVLKSSSVADPSHIFQVGEFYEKTGKAGQALYAYQQYLAYCPGAANTGEVQKRIARLEPQIKTARPVYALDTMVQKYSKGCLLFAEGEIGQNLYIIQEGAVKITKIVKNQEVVLAVLGKSDIFGEMAMLENKPRAATAEVYENSTLLAVSQLNFSRLLDDKPDIVIRLTTLMAERIWLLYRQLTNTFIENPLGRLYDALLIQLEKNRVNLESTNPYICHFGYKELMSMAGISEAQARVLYHTLTSEKKMTLNVDRIYITNVSAIAKEADIYRKSRQRQT